jgi:hypothetical protein
MKKQQKAKPMVPCGYEFITFRVSDNGIADITWHFHTTTGEIINNDTGVISFEEPAWVFYGNIQKEIKYDGYEFVPYGWNHGSQNPFMKYPVLIINAVDGSIIDPSKGY